MNREKVSEELKKLVESLGYQFVGVEFVREAGTPVLRLYADSPEGIGVDDCEKISQPVSALLDKIMNDFEDNYLLEVSSPGLERPLFSFDDYARFAGRTAGVKLKAAVGGRRRLTAVITGVSDKNVLFSVDGTTVEIPFETIASGHLIYIEQKGQKKTFEKKGGKH
ncbi:MAG: ribosome maturation factor RimP [Pyramidobacter sp.]